MDLTVRHARSSDASALARLAEQLGYPVPAGEIAARLARLSERRVVLVATDGMTIAGWTGISVDETLTEGCEAHIEGFVVDEPARSRGVGGLLLAAAEGWARERGAARIVVRSNTVRERAHAFYLRNGYESYKTQRIFRKRIEPG